MTLKIRPSSNLALPSFATRGASATAADLDALEARTITGGGLATGGGNLTASRVITVTKSTGAQALTGTNDTTAVTPLALATPLATKQDVDAGLTALGAMTGTGVVRQTGASAFDNDATKSDIGLPNVDNTTDLNKPISTATQTALDLKADNTDLTTLLSSSYAEILVGSEAGKAVTPSALNLLRLDVPLDLGLTTGNGTNYACSLRNGTLLSIADKQKVRIRFHTNCLANPDLTIDGLGAYLLKTESGAAFAAGELGSNRFYEGEIVTSGLELRLQTTESLYLRGLIAAIDPIDDTNVGSAIAAASGKTFLVNADTVPLIDSEASNVLKRISWGNIKATLWTALGALIAGGTTKATPVDADTIPLSDSAASDATKKLSWLNLKATLLIYFDTIYQVSIDALDTRIDEIEIEGVDTIPSPSPPISSVSQGRVFSQTSDGVVVLIQRADGSTTLGPVPAHDWHIEVRGTVGARHVWAIAEAAGIGATAWEFQVSTAHDGDDNYAPKLEGIRLSWISETAGTKTVKTANMAASIAPLSGSVTEMRGIHINGQSTSNGNANESALTTSPPSATRVFMPKNPKSGIRVLGNEQLQIRWKEPLRDEIIIDFEPAYERLHLSSGETGWARAGASLVGLAASSIGVFLGCVGIGSASYDSVKIGTVPGDNILKLIRRERIAANIYGRTYSHKTMWHCAHEGWVNTAQATIVSAIVAAQVAYTAAINKITGAVGDVILLMDGLASSGHYNAEVGATQTTPVVPYAVLAAAIANPTKIVAVCPRYFLGHLVDDVHLTAAGCLLRGEYFARADQRAVDGEANQLPVYMTSAVRTGAVILVTFNVWPSYEPLHFNNDLVTDPGNEGVEYFDTGGNAAAISSMVWVDVNQLEITLDMVPTGTSPVIRIASQAIDATGPLTGPRSRISDTAPDGFDNYAWPQQIAVT